MLNICGCLVHVMPGAESAVTPALEALAGVEVHAAQDGRLVVTVEDTAGILASEQIMAMHQVDGVINVALHYHHFEEADGEAGDTASVVH